MTVDAQLLEALGIPDLASAPSAALAAPLAPIGEQAEQPLELDPLDAEWAELLAEPLVPVAAELPPPPIAKHASIDVSDPVVESDEEDEASQLVPRDPVPVVPPSPAADMQRLCD